MLVELLQWLGHGYAYYRAFQDAGIWLDEMTADARAAYMEALVLGAKR